MSRYTSSLLAAAALIASVSALSAAQKGKGGHPPKADHESSMGAAHEGMKGDKDRMGDMKHAENAEDRAERAVVRDAHEQSSRLLRGVKLTAAERQQVKEIDKKYESQLKALKKTEKAADKAGTQSDAAYEQKVAALAAQERADIRAILSAPQQTRFDANMAARRVPRR